MLTFKQRRDQAEALLKQGLGNREVCRLSGLSYGAVHRMRDSLGIPRHHSVGYTGLPKLVAFLESLGHHVQVMPFAHRFDLLVDGVRCEVKCAELGFAQSTRLGYYTFSLAGSASGALENDFVTVVNGVAYKDYSKTCEALILAGFRDGHLCHVYRAASNAVRYGRRTFKVNLAGALHPELLWYDARGLEAA